MNLSKIYKGMEECYRELYYVTINIKRNRHSNIACLNFPLQSNIITTNIQNITQNLYYKM